MEHKVTQKTLLLEYLKKFGSIDPATAYRELCIYRLSARIADLKNDGHIIKSETVTSISSFTGRPVHYAKYVLQ